MLERVGAFTQAFAFLTFADRCGRMQAGGKYGDSACQKSYLGQQHSGLVQEVALGEDPCPALPVADVGDRLVLFEEGAASAHWAHLPPNYTISLPLHGPVGVSVFQGRSGTRHAKPRLQVLAGHIQPTLEIWATKSAAYNKFKTLRKQRASLRTMDNARATCSA